MSDAAERALRRAEADYRRLPCHHTETHRDLARRRAESESRIRAYFRDTYDGPADGGGSGIDPAIRDLMDAWADAHGIVGTRDRWEAVMQMIDQTEAT
jgi:hypothetical protein